MDSAGGVKSLLQWESRMNIYFRGGNTDKKDDTSKITVFPKTSSDGQH
jgi:hypothetical protein